MAKVFAGPLEKTLWVSGSVGARNFAAIVAPRLGTRHGGRGGGPMLFYDLVLIHLAAPGSLVKKGEVIAEFDNQWEDEHLQDHRARVVQTKAVVEKRKAEIAIETETEQQLMRTVRADHDKARLDWRTAEVRSAIDAEKMKLAVEETAARYKQLQEEVSLKKLSQQAGLRFLDMQVEQEEHHVGQHTRNLERMKMKAPIDGLVVMQSIFRSGQMGQVQEGDQVHPGTYFVQIVDLSQMVVSGAVNQTDSHGLALGQRATVRLDAYPELVLPGRLTSIGAMAGSGSRFSRGARDTYVKQIPVRIAIEARDPRLLPDLSASADLKLKAEGSSLQIPREAVSEEEDKAFVLVRQGESFQKRLIQPGMQNNTHAVVLSGLSQGGEVALEAIETRP